MKSALRAAMMSLLWPAALLAANPPTDIKAPQSPLKPKPAWLKLVDQGQFDPRLKGYMAPEGFRVEIVAEQPTIVNPVGMAFGNDGTLFVLEWRPSPGDEWRETPVEFTYKDGTKRNVATMKKKTKDVLKVLKWNDAKKIYDQAEVILEDELPSTVLLHDGWIYTASRGSVRRYKQSKPGGAYDVKEIIAQGFCGFHHHQVSGLTIGNDGWLYITSGDDDNYVEGSDGNRSTVLRTGAIFRCRPDGTKLHAYSMGWRNPYRDLAYDAAFNWFHVDNDNEDGSKFTGCRIMHVVEDSDFGWRLFTGARCCRPDPVRGAVYGELPGKLPPMLKTGRGSPAGLLIYNDTRFPEHHRGWLIYPDVFRKLVRAYQVMPDNSTYQIISEFEFLKSDDPLFRPCQMITGPDGAMYVCDWRTDSGGAGKLWGDGQHGRIYRIRWVGDADDKEIPLRGMDSWAKIVKQNDDDLVKSLYLPDFTDRVVAQHEIVRRGAKFRSAMIKIATDGAFPIDARFLAIGAMQSMWNEDSKQALIAVLNDPNQDVVRLAADGLSLNCLPGDVAANQALVNVLDTAGPAARRSIILALGRLGLPGNEDYLINVYKSDSGRDVFMTDAVVRALERLGARGIQKFLEMSDSGVERNLDRVVDAFLMFRTRSAAEAIPYLIRNPHLKVAQRVALLKSFANYLFDPPLGPDLLLAALQSQSEQPAEVKKAGLEALGLFGEVPGNKLTPLLLAWLQDSDPEMRLTAIRTAEQTKAAGTVPLLLQRLADETWTIAERSAIVKALRAFNSKSSAGPLAAIARDDRFKSPEGVALRVEALRSLLPVDPPAAQAIAEAFLAKDATLQSEAVAALGTQPSGAKKVAELFLANKLPRELLPQVSDALRKHLAANPDFGKLLTEVMRGGLLVSLDKAQIERMQSLVKSRGNPVKGRELYLNGKTLACINCHKIEGVGSQVGPDLTRVWDTHTLEKIMESMIDPNKEIKEGYQSYRLTTRKGLTYTGLKVADTATDITLKEATGKEVKVPKSEVEEFEASKQSLMPDNVISQLTFEQFIDLVSFLKDKAAQEALRGLGLNFWVIGPYAQDLKMTFPPEKGADPNVPLDGVKPGEKFSWQARQAEPSGYLDLRAVFNQDHITAYALTYVFSPKAQKASLFTGSDDQIRVWLNGKQVIEHAVNRQAKPDSDRAEVELSAGWNTVLAKVTNSVATHGLYLRFAGGEGLRLSLTKE